MYMLCHQSQAGLSVQYKQKESLQILHRVVLIIFVFDQSSNAAMAIPDSEGEQSERPWPPPWPPSLR